MASFPWADRDIPTLWAKHRRPSFAVGWPYRDMLLTPPEFRTTVGHAGHACIEAALAGGWAWFLTQLLDRGQFQEDLRGLALLLTMGAIVMAGLRLSHYLPVISDNLCWGHRIANHQWIIPRHDQIFVAPLLIIVTASCLPGVLYGAFGASMAVSVGITIGLTLLIARGAGPSIQELHMTGIHSISGSLSRRRDSSHASKH